MNTATLNLTFRTEISRLFRLRWRGILWLLLWLGEGMMPLAAQQHQFGDFRYTVNDGFITITRYLGPGYIVSIPATISGQPVRTIGANAFYNTSITHVTIPESVMIVGDGAFADCRDLKQIEATEDHPAFRTIDGVLLNKTGTLLVAYPASKGGSYTVPDGVTALQAQAFRGSLELTGVTIPHSVTSMGEGVFSGCVGLTNVTIPNGVTSIGEQAFRGCWGLTSITLPNNITSIGNETFAYCESLANVAVPSSVTSIGNGAFANCESLVSVSLPDSLTSIGKETFAFCHRLISMAIPENVTSIEDQVFLSCSSLTHVTIPSSVTSIGFSAFAGCQDLKSVLFPNSIATIGQQAFLQCPGLTSVDIPDSVISIGNEAFASCSNLTRITIGHSVTSIGDWVFRGCTSLGQIEVAADNDHYRSRDGVLFNKSATTLVQYPGGRVGRYAIPHGVTTIGEASFALCTGLTGVSLPDSLTSIERHAFSGCTKLLRAVIPASVLDLGAGAFSGCASLTGLVFLGNAPDATADTLAYIESPFANTAPTFTIYYRQGHGGFSSSIWPWSFHLRRALRPTDDVPEAMAVAASPGQFSLATMGKAGRLYQLQRTLDLVTGSWNAVTTAEPLATDEMVELADTAPPSGQAYYRITEVELGP